MIASLAYPFLPADPEREGLVVEAPPDWSFDRGAIPSGVDSVVWGRMPEAPGHRPALVRAAARREMALRSLGRRIPSGLQLATVHRLPPHGLRSGARGNASAALRCGALVELAAPAGRRRVLDAVAEASGATRLVGNIYAGSGGTVLARAQLADGSPAILRIGRAGERGDPAHLADELERLAALGVPLAPALLGRGTVAGASWVAELALPGRPPARVTAELTRQVVQVCARFPRAEGPPTAPLDDLLGAADRLPGRAAALRRLSSDLAVTLAELSAVLRHGDLWTGNLLVDRRWLSGVIDWDAAHPAGVPGADLLQLVATDARRRAHQDLGQAFRTCPWRSDQYRAITADYWPALRTSPHGGMLEAAGIAWWAAEVHHTLVRLPHRAADERWVAANVDSVLAALGY